MLNPFFFCLLNTGACLPFFDFGVSMDFISFRCTSCNQGLKIGADKAGRKIKCTKCGTPLTIPSSDDARAAAASAGPQMAPEAPPKPVAEEEFDDKQGYGLLSAPAEEEQLETKDKKEDKKKLGPMQRKLKTLPDLDLWEKVKAGLQVVSIGVIIWGGVILFTVLILVLGIISGPDYAETVDKYTPLGAAPDVPAIMLSLVAGIDNEGLAKTFYILAAVVAMFQVIILMAGYGVCLKVPDRFGSLGQVKALLALGGLNFFVILIFKLLPILGVINYLLVPYALPEVSLLDANIDRDPPLWVAWSAAPFLDMTLNVVFLCLFYAQPVLIGVFIWSIGLAVREDPVVRKGEAAVVLTLGVAFCLLAFHLLSMTGTSGVALGVLRVLYAGWVGFTILLLVRLPMALKDTRAILQKYLDGAEMKDEDDEEGKKPKRKRKPVPEDDGDDD